MRAEHLRIVHGGPTDEELAALTAILAASDNPRETPSPATAGSWNDRAADLRAQWPAQRSGAWRASAR